MKYQWNSDLETGNEIIDKQHKELFAMLNNLIGVYQNGKNLAELDKAIEFLRAYVVKHFADEEKLQEEYDYYDILNHKMYHRDFKNTVSDFVSRLEKEGYSDSLLEIIIQSVADWLVNHIKGDDFKMAAHIQSVKLLKQEE
ncbi:MAG: hemerythrin family protein [Endomicrobium sp.]|jgi:hemerythrin|nr:hemerythrin family protein [Endomicrobium sp.]